MMKLSHLKTVQMLRDALTEADRILRQFEAVKEDTVPAVACLESRDFGRFAGAHVALLPVPKQVAVSAAIRERSKIVQQLAELGVEVDHVQED